MKTWFRMEVTTDNPEVADILVYDAIGGWWDDEVAKWWNEDPGTTAKSFIDKLAALPDSVKTIRIRINSPGGDAFSAVAIANALRDQSRAKGRTVEAHIEGLAASAATVVMMGAERIVMADNALLLVHNPFTWAIGEASVMRKAADDLDALRDALVATYQWHSKLSAEDIAALMDAETWMSASEAIERGFATEQVEGLKAAAMFPRAALATLPEKLRAQAESFAAPPKKQPEAPKPAAALEVMQVCREANCLEEAEGLMQAGATLEAVRAHVANVKTKKHEASQRQSAIEAACAKVNLPELASEYVNGGMSVDAINRQLTVITAKLDKVEIDANLTPEAARGANAKRADLDPVAIYAARNNRKANE